MLIVLLHAVAAACFLTMLTGWLSYVAAALVLALGMAAAWDRALLRGRHSPHAIELRPSGEAVCLFANGDSAPVEARGSVNRHWVALRLRAPWRRSLLVAAGMLPPESFRRLRLWALWGRLPGVAPLQLPHRP